MTVVLPLDKAKRFLLDRVAADGHNAGDENAAELLAGQLGNLPLALEHVAGFISEVKWTFEKYCAAPSFFVGTG